jgi:hypothetical protein
VTHPLAAMPPAEAIALISEGLCPVDRERLVPHRLGLGVCPRCVVGYWAHRRPGEPPAAGYVNTFQAVTTADAVWPSPDPPPR